MIAFYLIIIIINYQCNLLCQLNGIIQLFNELGNYWHSIYFTFNGTNEHIGIVTLERIASIKFNNSVFIVLISAHTILYVNIKYIFFQLDYSVTDVLIGSLENN